MSQLVSPQTRAFLRERKLSWGVGLLVFVITAGGLANFFFGWYAGFGEVVGASLPPGASIIRQAFTDDGSTRCHWISFTASQADLQTIIVRGKFQPNYNSPSLGFSSKAARLAHRGKTVFLAGCPPPSWWEPSRKPDHYIVYERTVAASDAPDEEEHNYRSLVVSPGSHTVYALYEMPY